MKYVLLPVLAFAALSAVAGCSGTHDVRVGESSDGAAADTVACESLLASADVCTIQLSGTPAEQARARRHIEATVAFDREVSELVRRVHRACSSATFLLGGSSSLSPSPGVSDVESACAELSAILVARGPLSVTWGPTTCVDVPRATCPGVDLPPRVLCASPQFSVSPSLGDLVRDDLGVILAARAHYESFGALGAIMSSDMAALYGVQSSCIPPILRRVKAAVEGVQAVVGAVGSVADALD